MSELAPWVQTCLAIGFIAFAVGIWVVAVVLQYRRRPGRKANATGVIQVTCSNCSRPLVFQRDALEPLSPAEMALAVRDKPWVLGRRLGEYVCPYCEAAHCFTMDKSRVEWVGENLSQPQARSVKCFECRRPLRRPPGVPEQTLKSLPNPSPDHGLECPHCHAVCCFECCQRTTQKRTKDGSLLCPRCSRGPVEKLFFP